MKEWIISIVAVALFTSIICLILPQGKMGKYIRNIFSLLIMLVIIKPIININDGVFEYKDIVVKDEIMLQQDFINYINNLRLEEYKQNCLKIIEEKGVKNSTIDINYLVEDEKNFKISFVQINLQNSVIISDNQHINIKEEMVSDIASYLNINKSKYGK